MSTLPFAFLAKIGVVHTTDLQPALAYPFVSLGTPSPLAGLGCYGGAAPTDGCWSMTGAGVIEIMAILPTMTYSIDCPV